MQKESHLNCYIHDECIFVVEFYHIKTKNAITESVYLDLVDAITHFSCTPSLKVLLFTGYGESFTSGMNVKEAIMKVMNSVQDTEEERHKIKPSNSNGIKFMNAMLSCPKLIMAAVNGPAIGIGVTLLLHCDYVYAVDTATFWTPFTRVGIVPEFASSFTFPHYLGRELAFDMLIRSKKIDVKKAYEHELVSKVLPTKDFLSNVLKDIKGMMENSTEMKLFPHYKRLMKLQCKEQIRKAIEEEFIIMDKRFVNGELIDNMTQLMQSMETQKSKL